MNIINKTFLNLALLPSGLYRKMGVDILHLRAILRTKLTMDDRRPNTLHHTQTRKKSKPVSAATIGTMILSAIMGALFLFAFMIGKNYVTSLTVYFIMFFVMLSATLISDFTSVLIDVRDSFIILPKPVSDRTFVLARLLHIFIHICKIVLPMALPGIIYMATNTGIGGMLLFVLMVLMVTAFSIFFINAVYLLILKITTPQKFKSIISYIQIVFAIVIYASYQIMPRMIDKLGLNELDINNYKGIVALPLYWFASAWNILYTFSGSATEIVAAVLAFLIPALSIYIVVRYLAPAFNNKLAMISGSGGETAVISGTRKKASRRGYGDLLARGFTRGNAEKMGFLFCWKMMGRSRDFKLKVYPAIGYLLVYVVIMFMNTRSASLEDLQDGASGKIIVLSILYFSSFLLTMGISQMVYSEKYKASWIYHTTPLAQPGAVILGAAKAAIFKFYIPLLVVLTIAALALIGPAVMPNIIFGLFNQLFIASMLVLLGHKYFPFSAHQSNQSKGGTFIRSILLLFISAIIAVGHYVIYENMYVVPICCLLSIAATWMVMSSIRNTSWNAIKSSYSEE